MEREKIKTLLSLILNDVDTRGILTNNYIGSFETTKKLLDIMGIKYEIDYDWDEIETKFDFELSKLIKSNPELFSLYGFECQKDSAVPTYNKAYLYLADPE